MNKSKKLLKQARDNRLKNANKIPKKLTVKIRVYNRNSDVLAAVLLYTLIFTVDRKSTRLNSSHP